MIDTSPDLRTQLLRAQVDHVDAAIVTHDHADHTHGMDDLRPYTFIQKTSIPVFADEQTSRDLTRKFPYIFDRENLFKDKPILGGGIPQLHLERADQAAKVTDEPMEFYPLPHGHHQSLGIRHMGLAYLVDCREIPATVIDALKGKIELLIIDCLRYHPHSTHLHLEQTLTYIEAIAPRAAVLTHMGHELEYLDLLHQLERRGVKNVFPAIDGQSFFYS